MRTPLILTCLMSLSSIALGHECIPTLIPQAEFGALDLSTQTDCPNLLKVDEQSCEVNETGIMYGISEGLVVNKEISSGHYSGPLPFKLLWGDLLEDVVTKIGSPRDRNVPTIFISPHDSGYVLGTDTCLLTHSKNEYSLELYFDKKRRLNKVIGRIIYP